MKSDAASLETLNEPLKPSRSLSVKGRHSDGYMAADGSYGSIACFTDESRMRAAHTVVIES